MALRWGQAITAIAEVEYTIAITAVAKVEFIIAITVDIARLEH
jgi:hypothetical protein